MPVVEFGSRIRIRNATHGTIPATNAGYWIPKLARNVERDRATNRALRAAGWRVVRVWEHQDPDAAARRIERAVRSRLG